MNVKYRMAENMILPGMSDFNVWTKIHKFSEIEIKPNTLVLCDIDETFLHHPAINNTWIMLIHNFFCIQTQKRLGKLDNNMAYLAARRYIDEIIDAIPFRHTDEEGFFAMMNSAEDFAFVTARYPTAKEFTHSNLRSMNLDPENFNIHYCGDIAKGEYIMQNFDLSKYDHVVFIDDQLRNLENVYFVVPHSRVEIYHFKYEMEMSSYDYYPLPPGIDPNLRFDGEMLRDISIRMNNGNDSDKQQN
jgi:hypothetical protein